MATELLVVQHVDREGPDRIAAWAAQRKVPLRLIRPGHGEALPDPLHHGPAVAVLLGGPMGVNERQQPELHWLAQELAWLKQWLAQGRPTLGICLGAQLLCVASGGGIEPLRHGSAGHPLREVGFGAISWKASDKEVPWLKHIPRHQLVLHWHGDRCLLPPQAQLLASTLLCQEQAFQIGSAAVGLQFHVEASPASVERWIREDQEFIKAAGSSAEQIRSDQLLYGDELEQQASTLLHPLLDSLLIKAEQQT